MPARHILLTLAAAAVILFAGLAWKPTTLTTHSAHAQSASSNRASVTAAPASTTPDVTAARQRIAQFQSLKQRAASGDSASKRLLAEAYDTCMFVNQNAEQYRQRIEVRIQNEDTAEGAAVLENLLRRRLQDCAAVESGAPVAWKGMRLLYAQAAQGGDLPARLMEALFNPQPPLRPEQAAMLIEEVVASRDPAAVYALGDLVGEVIGIQVAEPYTPLDDAQAAGLAWKVAACRIGLDCGPESPPVSTLCLLQGWCYQGTYEEAIRKRLRTDARREALDRQVEAILRAMEASSPTAS